MAVEFYKEGLGGETGGDDEEDAGNVGVPAEVKDAVEEEGSQVEDLEVAAISFEEGDGGSECRCEAGHGGFFGGLVGWCRGWEDSIRR